MISRRTIFLLAVLATIVAAALALVPGENPEDPAEEAREAAEEKLEAAGFEPPEELLRFQAAVSTRTGAETPNELPDGLRQKARLSAQNRVAPLPGSDGTWSPYGSGPLLFAAEYPAAYGDGFGGVGGRVNDFAYVESTGKLYAAVANGGVWRSTDLGKSWTSIGDGLPIGSTGGIAWTPANGGTLIVATGDHAFSNDYAGVGVYHSNDDGAHWTKSEGVPSGALSFRIRVDPTNPQVVYYASGLGLFRSIDGGHSFANVNLPTGECTGNSFTPNCFFANIVTDVVVQPKDDFGHAGGAVLAAIGWRAGQRPNFAGKPEGVGNGLYKSATGAPGSFTKLPDSSGFTPADRQGRVEFGVADGPGQNGGYVYAISQDAELFNKQTGGENDIPLVGTPSVLDAIYVSSDFGDSWEVMESREEFYNAANGSALAQLTGLGIGPGFQVTYNQYIKPDPTRHVGGVPTRVILGMEEVWQNSNTQVPQDGHSQFNVIGQYTANGSACLVIPEACGAKQQVAGNTTTHPDQHGVVFAPTGESDLTLIVGNDGGVYTQTVSAPLGEFNQLGWGEGANQGFHTLLPYGVAMAKDGTAWAGLQDNGQLKITPEGKQYATYVGDGIFALVDPDNSKIAYDELPGAGINVTTDGGVTWTSMAPDVDDADFVAPMVMDPGDAKHIMSGGRQIAETTFGPETGADGKEWKNVYDLGTSQHPGDANATASQDDPGNHITSAQVIGDDAYVGFCGSCDPVKLKQLFHNGIATNVSGDKPGKRMTSDGWHIAKAAGLPSRTVTSVAMDPNDHRAVYVTLAASAARYWAPMGSQGEDTSKVGTGHVYKSTDAGDTFRDITRELPNVQTTWVIVRGSQLIVSTGIGVFISSDLEGTDWAPLGNNLPPVATFSMQLKPGDPNTLVAATYGRGIYTYSFNSTKTTLTSCIDRTRPTARLRVKARAAVRKRRLRLRGTARDRACGKAAKVRRVQVAISRPAKRKKCRFVNKKGRVLRKARSCKRPVWVKAKGTKRWTLKLKRRLPRGTYRVRVRAQDPSGNKSKIGKRARLKVRVR